MEGMGLVLVAFRVLSSQCFCRLSYVYVAFRDRGQEGLEGTGWDGADPFDVLQNTSKW